VLGQGDLVHLVAGDAVERRPREPLAPALDGLQGSLEGDLEVGELAVDVVVGLLAERLGLPVGPLERFVGLPLGNPEDLRVGQGPLLLVAGGRDDLLGLLPALVHDRLLGVDDLAGVAERGLEAVAQLVEEGEQVTAVDHR
jgi:hypothetical protein